VILDKHLEARSPLLARNTTTLSLTMATAEVCPVEGVLVHKAFACAQLIFDPAPCRRSFFLGHCIRRPVTSKRNQPRFCAMSNLSGVSAALASESASLLTNIFGSRRLRKPSAIFCCYAAGGVPDLAG
jgi:hypothetical protein